jgi:hypothetical protein
METALFRSLMMAVPDIDDYSSQKVEDLWALCRRFFAWEMEMMRQREPSEPEKRDHQDVLRHMIRVVKLLLKVEENKRLRMLQVRLNESWETFYDAMSEREAESVLSGLALK